MEENLEDFQKAFPEKFQEDSLHLLEDKIDLKEVKLRTKHFHCFVSLLSILSDYPFYLVKKPTKSREDQREKRQNWATTF